MEKALSQITRAEWIAINWIEIDPVMGGDSGDRVFMGNNKRTPDEAAEAAMDWDSTIEEREEFQGVEL